MNLISRTITGASLILVGLILIIMSFFLNEKSIFWIWIYGIPIFVIGFFILFNKREDKIEQIKSGGKKK